MKKIISLLCAISVIFSMSAAVFAADVTRGSLSMSLAYLDTDMSTPVDEITKAGQVVLATVSAEGVSDTSLFDKSCQDFSAISYDLTYDTEALSPFLDYPFEAVSFKANYSPFGSNKPNASTDGVISTGSPSYTSNVQEPGHTPNGKVTMIINEATSGFAINGSFITYYFVVNDPSKSGDIGLVITDSCRVFDDRTFTVESTTGATVAGMGEKEPELADFAALNAQIAAFEALTEADWTTDSWAVAKAAYDKAKAIDQATETNQVAVDEAAQALADAIAGLQKMPEPEPEITVEQNVTEKKYDDQHKTVGIGGTVTVPEGKSFTSLVFSLNNGTDDGTYTWEFGTPISATVTFGLNIWNTPADVTVTVNSVTAQ